MKFLSLLFLFVTSRIVLAEICNNKPCRQCTLLPFCRWVTVKSIETFCSNISSLGKYRFKSSLDYKTRHFCPAEFPSDSTTSISNISQTTLSTEKVLIIQSTNTVPTVKIVFSSSTTQPPTVKVFPVTTPTQTSLTIKVFPVTTPFPAPATMKIFPVTAQIPTLTPLSPITTPFSSLS